MIIHRILFYLLLCPVSSFIAPPAGQTRPNYGVDFNFLFAMNNMHGTWKHVWDIDLHILDRSLDHPSVICPSSLKYCQQASSSHKTIWDEIDKLLKRSTSPFQWMENPRILATLQRPESGRAKRSLLPFVGDIEKFFFGVATENDLSAIQKSIDEMTQLHDSSIKQIASLGDNLASLTTLVNDQLGNTKHGFDLIKSTFSNLTLQMNQRLQTYKEELNQLHRATSDEEHGLLMLWSYLTATIPELMRVMLIMQADTQLMLALQSILQGFLPISLIPPEQLQSGLRIAEQGIKDRFPEASLSYPENAIGYYYTHKVVTPIITSNKISLMVDIPVDLGHQLLHVYGVRTFPVPLLPYNPYTRMIDPTSRVSNAQSELITRHDIFMITSDGTQWSSARSIDIASCTGEMIKTCDHQFALYALTGATCIENLWLNKDFETILSTCSYRLSHTKQPTIETPYIRVEPLSNGRWYIVSPLSDKWTVVCPTRAPEIRKPCTSCVIQVDCGCGVSSKWFSIPTRVSSCSSAFSPLHKNYTFNPFSYTKDSHPWVMNLTGDTSDPIPLKRIPDITLPGSDKWDDVLEQADEETYNLNRLYLTQKNETRMFRSEAEALLTKIKQQNAAMALIQSIPSWMANFTVILTFVNSGFIVIILLCVFPRVRSDLISEELDLVIHTESSILTLDAINLVLNCIILSFVSILAWPIINNWIRQSRWYRQLKGQSIRIKAKGFRNIRGCDVVVLEGVMVFKSDNGNVRSIATSCQLGSVPANSYINPISSADLHAIVEESNGSYTLSMSKPIEIILPDETTRECSRFEFNVDYVNRKTKVPSSGRLERIDRCQVWVSHK